MWDEDPWPFEASEPTGQTAEELRTLLDLQLGLLISVSTGGPRIDDVNNDYKKRRRKLNEGLRRLGIEAPFPWPDLWSWHGYWSGNLGTYASRRAYIRELAAGTEEALERIVASQGVDDPGPRDVGWPALEVRIAEVKDRVGTAGSRDDLQDIGRRVREILIYLGNIVFESEMLNDDEEEPKGADAKARLTYAARSLMSGRAHEEWRALVRAAWDLANKITHSEGISKVDAVASVQAAILLVRTMEHAVADSPEEPVF